MSLYAYDTYGYVGDATSNKGWSDFIRVLNNSGDPTLISLANNGYSDELDSLEISLNKLGYGDLSPEMEAVRLHFLKLIDDCSGVLIISDGIGIDSLPSIEFELEEEDHFAWDDSAHPRHPSGSSQGGEFAPKGQVPAALASRLEEARKHGYHTLLFHGTKSDEPFDTPRAPEKEDFMLDRMLGAHYATDPALASKFAGGIEWRKGGQEEKDTGAGRVMPFVLAGKGLTVKQHQEWEGHKSIMTDQHAIGGLVAGVALSRNQELFKTWITKARAVDEPMAERIYARLKSGKAANEDWVPELARSNRIGVHGYLMDYDAGLMMLNGGQRRQAVNEFKDAMLDRGITHLRYINTSPTETEGIKDRRSVVVLHSDAVRSLYAPDFVKVKEHAELDLPELKDLVALYVWVVEVGDYEEEEKEYATQIIEEGDYAHVAKVLDELEEKTVEALQEIIETQRDAFIAKVQKGDIKADELDLSYQKDLETAINNLMLAAWKQGSQDGVVEVGDYVQEQYTEGLERWVTINGRRVLIDDKNPSVTLRNVMKPVVEPLAKLGYKINYKDGIEVELELKSKVGSNLIYASSMLLVYHRDGVFRGRLQISRLITDSKGGERDHKNLRWKTLEDASSEQAIKFISSSIKDLQKAPAALKTIVKTGKDPKTFSEEDDWEEGVVIEEVGDYEEDGEVIAFEDLTEEEHDYAKPKFKRKVTIPVVVPKSAIQWLDQKGLQVSGILSGRLLDDAKNIIINAMKTGETVPITVDKIFNTWEKWLGKAAVIVDEQPLAPWRLQALVRTTTTEAYNHGRLTEFLDPKMSKIIEGVRYTAILDSRTTPFCRYMHGRVFRLTDPDLASFVPPNHWNCRSMIIPIVIGMDVEDGFITPGQKGRARGLGDPKFFMDAGVFERYVEEEGDFSFDPTQPRDPKGSPTGGQWAGAGLKREGLGKIGKPDASFEAYVTKLAEDFGFPPDRVTVRYDKPPFIIEGNGYLAGRAYTVASPFTPKVRVGSIDLYYLGIRSRAETLATFAHEVAHIRYHDVLNKSKSVLHNPATAQSFPKVKAFAAFPLRDLVAKDGVTDYSTLWWRLYKRKEARLMDAMHETIAEVSRLRATLPKGWLKDIPPVWLKYEQLMRDAYKELNP